MIDISNIFNVPVALIPAKKGHAIMINRDGSHVYSCQHKWDGVVLNRPYAGNLGLCIYCGQECYIGIIDNE